MRFLHLLEQLAARKPDLKSDAWWNWSNSFNQCKLGVQTDGAQPAGNKTNNQQCCVFHLAGDNSREQFGHQKKKQKKNPASLICLQAACVLFESP